MFILLALCIVVAFLVIFGLQDPILAIHFKIAVQAIPKGMRLMNRLYILGNWVREELLMQWVTNIGIILG